MVLATRLQREQCIARLANLNGGDPKCREVASNRKYCFPKGGCRIATAVDGSTFMVDLWGVSGKDVVGRFRGTVADDYATGGSLIKGDYVRTFFSIVSYVLLAVLALFPLVASAGTHRSLGIDIIVCWCATMGLFAVALLNGSFYSRRLIKGFLKDLLEARPAGQL